MIAKYIAGSFSKSFLDSILFWISKRGVICSILFHITWLYFT